jgi:hypothetical protein
LAAARTSTKGAHGGDASIRSDLPIAAAAPIGPVSPVTKNPGAQAIVTAAQQIATGEVEVAIAGGMENMDRAPYLMDGGRWGQGHGSGDLLLKAERDVAAANRPRRSRFHDLPQEWPSPPC